MLPNWLLGGVSVEVVEAVIDGGRTRKFWDWGGDEIGGAWFW